MPSGGDLKEVTWQNSDAGQGRYFSKAGESHTIDLGGFKTDDSEDNVDSGGTFMNLKNTKPWSYEATLSVDEKNPNRMELETAQALSDSFNDTTWTFTNINNIIYTGIGSIVGDIKHDRSKATMSFKVMGGGILQQIN